MSLSVCDTNKNRVSNSNELNIPDDTDDTVSTVLDSMGT